MGLHRHIIHPRTNKVLKPKFLRAFPTDSHGAGTAAAGGSGHRRMPKHLPHSWRSRSQIAAPTALVSAIPTAEREAVPLDVRAVSVCAQSHAAAALPFRLHSLPSVLGRRSNPRVPRHERTFFFFFLGGYRLPAGGAADRGAMFEMRRHRTGNARGSKM